MALTVGEQLRKARTERGIELGEVERATKVRAKFLEAMEDDRWDALPGPSYARGFLDIYARYLGLDEKELLDELGKTEGDRSEPIPQSVIKPGVLQRHRPTRRMPAIEWGRGAKVAAGLLALAVIGLVVLGSIGGSDDDGGGSKKSDQKAGEANAAAPQASTTTPANPGQVSVELRSTAPVWVCLVEDGGNPLVDGETLATDQGRGPFSARGFEVTFGNGSVEMTVDGQPAKVPALAEPLGYRITPDGVRRLAASSQPTCV